MLNMNQTSTRSIATRPVANRPVGEMLRAWRQHRRLSQLALACDADISTRHLSFLETGRSQPSRQMLEHLTELLAVPPRERNLVFLAAGFAPLYTETALDSPAAEHARRAVEAVLSGHEPSPALAIDRHWTLVAANRAVNVMLVGVAPELLEPPVNVLRLSLHAEGLAPRIVNFAQWRAHVLARLRTQIATAGDEELIALHAELEAYPCPAPTSKNEAREQTGYGEIAVPLRIRTGEGVLSFLTTTTVFGTAVDLTFSELAIESFFPADQATAAALRRMQPEPD